MLLLLFLPILLLLEIAGVSTYARRMQPSPSLELSFAKVSSQSWSTAVQLLRWERDMSSSMARRVLYLFACPPKSVPVYLCSGLESELEGLMGKDFGREGEGDVRTVASCSGSCRFRIPKPVNMRRMKMEVDFTDTSGCFSTGILHVGV